MATTYIRRWAAVVAAICLITILAPGSATGQQESVVEWAPAPTCAADDTTGITAVVTNATDASAEYTIEVRDRRSQAFVHGSHDQPVDARDAGRIILGGMPNGTWVLTMLENGQLLGSSTVAMTFSDLDCANQPTWMCGGLEATLVGTDGDDELRGTNGVDVIVALQGNDSIWAGGGSDVVCAGRGNDVVFGGIGFDIIFGAQGDDRLYLANGADVLDRGDTRGGRMFGGAGNDTLYGSSRWDRMQGGPGADTLFGYEGRDWMRGGSGIDNVNGGAAADDLHGGNGNDNIVVSTDDVVRGGAGIDTCTLASGVVPARLISCELG